MQLLKILPIFGTIICTCKCIPILNKSLSTEKVSGYILVMYPKESVDSNCLKSNQERLTNKCLLSTHNYAIDVIPNFKRNAHFDSLYDNDSHFELNGGITISTLDRRFNGNDLAELFQDKSLKPIKKDGIPNPTAISKLFLNTRAIKQSFAYRVFRFKASYLHKKVANSEDNLSTLNGISNLRYTQTKNDSLDIFFFKDIDSLEEISPANFKSDIFN